MDKIISISGKDVGFKASALTPRLYRFKLNRDMIQDLNNLTKAFEKNKAEDSMLTMEQLEIFENAAYIMAKQYDDLIPDSPDEWLDTFEMFSIWEILPQILDLWGMNQMTTSQAKKK